MKNVKMTTKQVFEVYKLLENARLTKMESSEILTIIQNMKSLKKVIDLFSVVRDKTIERLKDSEYKKMINKKNDLIKKKEEGEDITEEVNELNEYFKNFNSRISTVLNPDFIKENEIEIETLSGDSLAKLAEENNLSVSDLMKISDVFVE